MKLHCLIAFAAFSVTTFTTLPAVAQTKAGLWEVSSKTDALDEMQKQFDGMPAAESKMIREMLGKQSGMKIDGEGVSLKVCLTKEMISNPSYGAPSTSGTCKHSRSNGLGGVVKFSYSCVKPAVNVEGTVTNKGDNAYSSTMTSTSTVDGKPHTSTVRSKGKFLSADCGNVKPIAAP